MHQHREQAVHSALQFLQLRIQHLKFLLPKRKRPLALPAPISGAPHSTPTNLDFKTSVCNSAKISSHSPATSLAVVTAPAPTNPSPSTRANTSPISRTTCAVLRTLFA